MKLQTTETVTLDEEDVKVAISDFVAKQFGHRSVSHVRLEVRTTTHGSGTSETEEHTVTARVNRSPT